MPLPSASGFGGGFHQKNFRFALNDLNFWSPFTSPEIPWAPGTRQCPSQGRLRPSARRSSLDQAVLRLAAFWLPLPQPLLATIFCFAVRSLHPIISLASSKPSSSLGQSKLNRGLRGFVHWAPVHLALISGQFFL